MSEARSHPRFSLNPLVHAPVRLSVLAILAKVERVDFRFLCETLDVSESLLSKHVSALEAAGYVATHKTRLAGRARTWLSMTASGEQAFAAYKQAIDDIVNSGSIR